MVPELLRLAIESGRLPLLCFFMAFIAGFIGIRISVRLIRAGTRWWPRNVHVGDLHIHHVVFGVGLMVAGGIAGLVIQDSSRIPNAIAAGVFGLGSALVLDEFALILHLRDVYWAEEGRASVDMVFVAIAIVGLLLVGERPLGLADALAPGDGFYWTLLSVLANLALVVLTLLKGKFWTGLIGVLVPVLPIIGAVRLARPGSPWARWRYVAGSRKDSRAQWRERRLNRPIVRAKIWFQELICGRHG